MATIYIRILVGAISISNIKSLAAPKQSFPEMTTVVLEQYTLVLPARYVYLYIMQLKCVATKRL